MFGNVEALVEKYPVLFTLGLLINSILRGKTLVAHSREDQPSFKKFGSFVYYLLPCFALLMTQEGFTLSYI